MNQHQPIPPPQPPSMGPPGMGRPGPMGPSGPGPYPPQPSRRRRRVWPWVVGSVLVVAVVAGVGVMVGNMWRAKISSRPTATHTYPERFPDEKLPAQIDGYKLDQGSPNYQILRPSRENPNVVDISRSERIGVMELGIDKRGAKRYSRHEEPDELEPGVYCTKTEGETDCYAASNSGRIWWTHDTFDSLTRKQLARWTTHFIAAVKE